MGLGILPWALVMAWVITFLLTTVPGRPPRMFILDPLAMLGLMMATFAGALVVAGIGTLWSLSLTRRHAELRSRTVTVYRTVVVLVLAVPLLWSVVGR